MISKSGTGEAGNLMSLDTSKISARQRVCGCVKMRVCNWPGQIPAQELDKNLVLFTEGMVEGRPEEPSNRKV